MSGADAIEAGSSPAERTRAAAPGAWLRNPAVVCLAVAVCLSGVILIKLGSHLILFDDEWETVLYRHEFSAHNLLYPHGGHLILAMVAIYDLLLATFGLTSPVPFHAVSTLIYLLAAVLLFAYARRRVGDWLALLGTTVILFFGASALDLLFPFQMVYSGAIAAGLAALLALDCDDRRGDVIACVLLVVSISFGEVGIAFAVGVLVRVALTPGGWRVGCTWSSCLWSSTPCGGSAGDTPHPAISVCTTSRPPRLTCSTPSPPPSGRCSATKLSGNQEPIPVGQVWAPIMLVVAVALAAWRVRRLGGVPRGVWPAPRHRGHLLGPRDSTRLAGASRPAIATYTRALSSSC